jgi:hypothetical protein
MTDIIQTVETEAKSVDVETVSLFDKVVTAYTTTWAYWMPAIVVAFSLGHFI